jgi:hypothetical protein
MHDPFQTYASMSPYGGSPYGGAPYAGSPYGAPYYGTLNPMGLPYNVQQTAANPLAAINPFAAAALGISPGNPTTINPITGVPQAGQQGFGLHPAQSFINSQQLQLAALAAGLQNPIVAALLSNPLIAAGLHPQLGQPQQFGQQPQQFGQPQQQFGQPQQFGQIGGSPYGQVGPTAGFGYPLAPQSWVGQAGQLGGGQSYGQIHPLLAQLAARSLQGQGLSPWGY